MTAWARNATRVAVVLVAAGTLMGAGPARADADPPSLGGYQGTAHADGLHVFYNPEGLLPLGAVLDFGAPNAYATIATGPATFARSSAADPGDLLANPDALLAAGAPGYQPGTVPAYPYRATAGSGVGAPDDESAPGPGLDARAHADGQGSEASATMPAASTPAVATFGSMSSTATTSTDGATVTTHAHSEITDLDVLGVVKIGSVVTDLTATSDGTTTTVSGGTVVSDASIAGTPVEIDTGGVRPKPGTTTTTNALSGVLGRVVNGVHDNLDDVLANAGIDIAVASPRKAGDENDGELTTTGLRIGFELSDRTFPALSDLLDQVPYVPGPPGAPTLGDLIAVAQARHLVALEIGRGQVALSASPGFSFDPGEVNIDTPTPTVSGSGTSFTTPDPVGSSVAPVLEPSPAPTAQPTTTPIGDELPAVPIGAGIGALALLALIAQPFIGDRLGRAATAVLAGDAGPCPWEES